MTANTQNSEIIKAISDSRSRAMFCAANARNIESGYFRQIAQDLDFALPKVAQIINQRDELLAELDATLTKWEARSRDALPADSMLINRHVRELKEAIAKAKEGAES